MNFIIEILPKKENSSEYVFVVRASNGFPISVCDTLHSAMVVIQEKLDDANNANSNA